LLGSLIEPETSIKKTKLEAGRLSVGIFCLVNQFFSNFWFQGQSLYSVVIENGFWSVVVDFCTWKNWPFLRLSRHLSARFVRCWWNVLCWYKKHCQHQSEVKVVLILTFELIFYKIFIVFLWNFDRFWWNYYLFFLLFFVQVFWVFF
jgi:hypothetical protein